MTVVEQIKSPVPQYLENLLDEVRGNTDGAVADYIPNLAEADPDPLAIALCTVSGRIYAAGDADRLFTMQSITKPFVFGLALQEHGEKVLDVVGLEPSGESFNELSLDRSTHRPMNPMINAGAIAVNQLINGTESSVEDRVAVIHDFLGRLAGRELSVDEDLADNELAGADRNLALAHMLRSHGVINDDARDAVDSYIRQCAAEISVRDLAVMAATLANGGVQPQTGERVLDPGVARLTLTVMSSAGMYDGAGRWMARVGIPAKSGVSGGLLGSLPGQLGIGTFSPRLDSEGNSVRGRLLYELLSDSMGLHLMNPAEVGLHAVRSILVHGEDTVLTLQGVINFSAAESILHEIARHDFTEGRLVLDVTRVVTVESIGRRFLSSVLAKMRAAGLDIALHDPEDRLRELTVDGDRPESLDAEELAEVEAEPPENDGEW